MLSDETSSWFPPIGCLVLLTSHPPPMLLAHFVRNACPRRIKLRTSASMSKSNSTPLGEVEAI